MGALSRDRIAHPSRLIGVARRAAFPGTLSTHTPMVTASFLKRLLVVDDDPKIRAIFTDFFGDQYRVEAVSTGADGLSAAMRERPDAVLLDIHMPGLTGLDVLKGLKVLDPRIPVIMVTANEDLAVAEQALKGGAFAYLPKPFHLQYAAHLVAAALEEKTG
jgi:two-component system nitrogen regulation response regulator GlnG